MQSDHRKKTISEASNRGPGETAPAPRILIADDDAQGVELLEAYLADSGYETRRAIDGEQTLHLVREWRPDVILLDIMMPKISGFEVCKRIRADAVSRNIGILMVTALDQSSDVDRAVEVGTNDFLTKPINKAELLLRIRSLLRSPQNRNNLGGALDYIEGVERAEN
jgi:DNA-binding response OmpR family regulator